MPGGTLCQVQNISKHATRKAGELKISRTTNIKVQSTNYYVIAIFQFTNYQKKKKNDILVCQLLYVVLANRLKVRTIT